MLLLDHSVVQHFALKPVLRGVAQPNQGGRFLPIESRTRQAVIARVPAKARSR